MQGCLGCGVLLGVCCDACWLVFIPGLGCGVLLGVLMF